jgi:hypothetical protein
MHESVYEIENLNKTFPDIIRNIKVYMGMDHDFEKICHEFEEITETAKILEKTDSKKLDKIKTQISMYKQLQSELKNEIESFIQEE